MAFLDSSFDAPVLPSPGGLMSNGTDEQVMLMCLAQTPQGLEYALTSYRTQAPYG
jgi:hypothetical protein